MPSEKKGVGCISGDGSESSLDWHLCFIDSLPYKFVEILDTSELFGLSPRVVVLISRVGM